MTGALVLVAMAAWWAIGPRRGVPGPPPEAYARAAGRRRWPLLVAGALGVSGLVLGARSTVVVAALVVVGATAARVTALRRASRRRRKAAAEVARACTVLAAELELGKIPANSLASAAEDCAVLRPAAAAAAIGADVVPRWRDQSVVPGQHGLLALAQAWQVATGTGAPLAPTLEMVAAALRADEEVDRLVAGELAAPRMTGVVLALLPVAGVALGYGIGGDPVGFLTGTPWGLGCLLAGCVLACAGVLWTEHLAAD